MKNKTLFLVFFILVGLVMFVNISFAQEPSDKNAAVVADVSVYNARIISQAKNDLKISFDIVNNEKIQPDIKYGVRLAKENKIIDEKIYSEALVLGAGELIKKEIEYSAPAWLSGDYEVWIISRNSRDLPLGINKAGAARLSGDGQFIEILSDSCFMTIDGSSEKNFIKNGGVLVSAGQKISGSCDILSHFKNEISVSPKISIQLASLNKQPQFNGISRGVVSIKPAEQKSVSFEMPQKSNPGMYILKLAIFDGNNQISSAVSFFFSLQGVTGQIGNLLLDKDYYSAGETAQVSILWHLAELTKEDVTDETEAPRPQAIFEISIKDADGKNCAENFLAQAKASNTLEKFSVPITKNCPNPKLAVLLKDQSGKVLDSRNFEITSKNPPQTKEPAVTLNQSLIILAGLILFGLILFVFRKKLSGKPVSMILFFLITAGVFLFLTPGAKAVTIEVTGGQGKVISYFVGGLQKSSYDFGEWISYSFSIEVENQKSAMFNAIHKVKVTVPYSPYDGSTEKIGDMVSIMPNTPRTPLGIALGHILTGPPSCDGAFRRIQLFGELKRNMEVAGSGTWQTDKSFDTEYIHMNCSSLNVTIVGSGTVTGADGFSCSSGTCTKSFTSAQSYPLTPTPMAGYSPVVWSGACSGTGACSPIMDYDHPVQNVTATFNAISQIQYTLAVVKNGTGNGTVVNVYPPPAGTINCGSVCSAQYNSGQGVSFQATPDANSVFAGYFGDCDPTGQVTMNSNKTCIATFNLKGCTPLSFNSATSYISPSSVSPGGTYYMYCDYGRAWIDPFDIIPPSGSCSYTGFSGTAAYFTCTAGLTPGTFTGQCKIINYPPPGSNFCASTNPINGTLTVTGPVCIPTNPNCAANTCVTDTCWDGCSYIPGTNSNSPPCACTDTSWSPDPSTVCSGQTFTQTSNCGNTRTATGTKNCAPGTYSLSVTKSGTGSGTVTSGDQLPSNPIANWKFNETSGTSALDSSGNGNTGTLVNGPLWVAGKLNNALSFDGSNDYVNAGSASSLDDIPVKTIVAWIYPRTFGDSGLGRIFDKFQSGTGWTIYPYGAESRLRYWQNFSSTTGYWDSAINSLALNTWQHIAVIYNRSSASNAPTFYINGVLSPTTVKQAPSGTASSDASQVLTIGDKTTFDRSFNGNIDEAYIYNRALTQSEIQSLYNAGASSGINCGPSCYSASATYSSGASVTLNASASTGSFTGWSGDVPASCQVVPVPAACTFLMTQSRNVASAFNLAPTVTISANPNPVSYNSPSTLTWSSTNTTACTASGSWSGAKATSGTQSTGNLTTTQTYTITCTGPGGSASNSVTVTVNSPAPIVTITANPEQVPKNGFSTITWSSTNANSCTASGSWSGAKATSGTQSTGSLTSAQTYILTCTGPGGTDSKNVTVNIIPSFNWKEISPW